MSPSNKTQEVQQVRAHDVSGSATARIVVFSAIGFAVVGAVAYLVASRIAELEQQVANLNVQVEAAEKRLEGAERQAAGAVESAEAARARAEEAEESAAEAARGRAQAEEARAQAEEAQVEAEQEADLAREEAQSAGEDARLAREETERIRKEREEEMSRLQEALSKIVETRRTALGLVMNLGADRIEFDFDRSELRPKSRELLSRIVGVLLTSDGYRVQVFGHTDYIGTEKYNQALSESRARAVTDYLIATGIDSDIVTMEGLGESSPLVEGTDPKSRQRNRRVEIGIVDAMIESLDAAPRRKQQ